MFFLEDKYSVHLMTNLLMMRGIGLSSDSSDSGDESDENKRELDVIVSEGGVITSGDTIAPATEVTKESSPILPFSTRLGNTFKQFTYGLCYHRSVYLVAFDEFVFIQAISVWSE